MNELALFAGAGGGILGGALLGWRTVCAVEIDPYAASVLVARQNDRLLPPFPIWDDVCTFDGRPWRGSVDVVSGGFPCQDISAAGKGAGIGGKRSGLWSQMARIIGEVRPRYAFVENSPCLVRRGLSRVLGDLAEMGFDARWGVVSAADAGAPHIRERIWIMAYSNEFSRDERRSNNATKRKRGRDFNRGRVGAHVADSDRARELQPKGSLPDQRRWSGYKGGSVCNANIEGLEKRKGQLCDDGEKQPPSGRTDWWKPEPDVGRVVNGVAARVDRLKAVGNGQVPAVVKLAWETLIGCERCEAERKDEVPS